MESKGKYQKYQCMGCAWSNPYSPRNADGFCEVCVKGMARMRELIKEKRAQRKEQIK